MSVYSFENLFTLLNGWLSFGLSSVYISCNLTVLFIWELWFGIEFTYYIFIKLILRSSQSPSLVSYYLFLCLAIEKCFIRASVTCFWKSNIEFGLLIDLNLALYLFGIEIDRGKGWKKSLLFKGDKLPYQMFSITPSQSSTNWAKPSWLD